MYTLEEKAIKFVIKAFENKKRLKEDINMSFHSISVGFMLKNITSNEEIIVSGLLHDILEDTDFKYEDIKKEFGEKIADNVVLLSEDCSIEDYVLRKKNVISNLYDLNEDIVLISLVDKLHNLVSDYDLWLEMGENIYRTENISFETRKWYYLELKKMFNVRIKNNVYLERYNSIVDLYFG